MLKCQRSRGSLCGCARAVAMQVAIAPILLQRGADILKPQTAECNGMLMNCRQGNGEELGWNSLHSPEISTENSSWISYRLEQNVSSKAPTMSTV